VGELCAASGAAVRWSSQCVSSFACLEITWIKLGVGVDEHERANTVSLSMDTCVEAGRGAACQSEFGSLQRILVPSISRNTVFTLLSLNQIAARTRRVFTLRQRLSQSWKCKNTRFARLHLMSFKR